MTLPVIHMWILHILTVTWFLFLFLFLLFAYFFLLFNTNLKRKRSIFRKFTWFKPFTSSQLRLFSQSDLHLFNWAVCQKARSAWVIEAFMYLHSWHSLCISPVGQGFPGPMYRHTEDKQDVWHTGLNECLWFMISLQCLFITLYLLHSYLCFCAYFLDTVFKKDKGLSDGGLMSLLCWSKTSLRNFCKQMCVSSLSHLKFEKHLAFRRGTFSSLSKAVTVSLAQRALWW